MHRFHKDGTRNIASSDNQLCFAYSNDITVYIPLHIYTIYYIYTIFIYTLIYIYTYIGIYIIFLQNFKVPSETDPPCIKLHRNKW